MNDSSDDEILSEDINDELQIRATRTVPSSNTSTDSVPGITNSLYNRYDYNLKCKNCIKWLARKKSYELVKSTHHCTLDCLMVVDRSNYFLVSPLLHNYPEIKFCFSFNAGVACKKLNQGTPCYYAHSDIEKTIWESIQNGEFNYKKFLSYLRNSKTSNAESKKNKAPKKPPTPIRNNFIDSNNNISYEKLHNSILKDFHFMLVCLECITFGGNVQYCFTIWKSRSHACKRDKLIARYSSGKDWFFIRSRYNRFNLPVALCTFAKRNRTCGNYVRRSFCSFAHSMLEFTVWKTLDNSNVNFQSLLEYVDDLELGSGDASQSNVNSQFSLQEASATTNTELQNHSTSNVAMSVRKTAKNQNSFVQPDLQYTVTKEPLKSESSTNKPRSSHSFSSMTSATSSLSINSRFKVEVKVLCEKCYQLYQADAKVHNVDSKICKHTSLQDHRAKFLVKNDNNRYVPIREPGFSKNTAVKYVRLCRNIKTQNSCISYKTKGFCPHPHSAEEAEVWNVILKYKLNGVKEYIEQWFETNGIPTSEVFVNQPHEVSAPKQISTQLDEDMCGRFFCQICRMLLPNQTRFDNHCNSKQHKENSSLDKDRQWHFRPPPILADVGKLKTCSLFDQGICKSNNCMNAHGEEMLEEWIERFEFRQMIKAKARQGEHFAYIDSILGEIDAADSPSDVLMEELGYIKVSCDRDLHFRAEEKNTKHHWHFSFTPKRGQILKKVALLYEKARHHFSLFSRNTKLSHPQVSPGSEFLNQPNNTYDVWVEFQSKTSYGTYTQSVVFDFGTRPLLEKCLLVDIGKNIESIERLRTKFTKEGCWDDRRYKVIKSVAHDDYELKLLKKFPLISTEELLSSEFRNMLHKHNWQHEKNVYKDFILKLIQMEHYDTKHELAKYNLETSVTLVDNINSGRGFILPNPAENQVKFMLIPFSNMVSEDTSEGRIFNYLDYFKSIWFRPFGVSGVLFEAPILSEEPYVEGHLVVVITSKVLETLSTKIPTCSTFQASVQFQVNGVAFAKMSEKVVSVTNDTLKFLFPSKFQLNVDSTRFFPVSGFSKLDRRQQHLVKLIMAETMATFVPPVLVYGPFGMGKTFTLSQSIIQLICRKNARILVCTMSNSAADLYITEYLSPALTSGMISASLMRIYATERKLTTISDVVRRYCLLDRGRLRLPTVEEINNSTVIVTTVAMCMHLYHRKAEVLPFTHIIIDEAAQVLEVDILAPILLASPSTRVVMAGDNVQISPAVFSKLARSYKFNVTLLERLFAVYHNQQMVQDNTVIFTNNYRSSQSILDFLSANFYQGIQMNSPKRIAPHPDLDYSLYFVNIFGNTLKNLHGTSFYNPAESSEVIDQVTWLKNNWPLEWGDFDNSVCVIVPYSEQREHIRAQLKRGGLNEVDCHTVRNVQGKEYRAIVISIVRTFESCYEVYQTESQKEDFNESTLEFGFLSNHRILNTAFSRARSLIICIGDARAMIGIGDNKNVFKDFIKRCINNGTAQPVDTSIEDIEDFIHDVVDYNV